MYNDTKHEKKLIYSILDTVFKISLAGGLLILLKSFGYLDWSWVWILAPFWLPSLIFFIAIILMLAVILIMDAF